MTSADMVRQNVERHSSKKGTTEMMNAPSPPSPVQDVFSVIQLISDPAAAKKRLAELNEAKAAAEKAQFSAADAKRLRAEHEKELAERRAKHDAEMSGERAFQDEQHRKRYDDLTARERVLEQKESDLERRLREVAKQEADVVLALASCARRSTHDHRGRRGILQQHFRHHGRLSVEGRILPHRSHRDRLRHPRLSGTRAGSEHMVGNADCFSLHRERDRCHGLLAPWPI
jgi:hypothetical protein